MPQFEKKKLTSQSSVDTARKLVKILTSIYLQLTVVLFQRIKGVNSESHVADNENNHSSVLTTWWSTRERQC